MSDKDDPKAIHKSRTLRTFGRALSFFAHPMKAVLTHPMKAVRRDKSKPSPEINSVPSSAATVPSMLATRSAVQLHPLETVRNEFAESLQNTQQILSGHLQNSAEFLRRNLTLSGAGATGFLSASCFPAQIVRSSKSSLTSSEESQDLICSGTRNLLRIKLYDFAIYLDRKDVQQSKLKDRMGGSHKGKSNEEKLAKQIRDSSDIQMSLLVRASRNLPILLLSKEYERILKRRLRVVDGDPNDPALRAMMETFREENLPAAIKQGGSVKKGTVLVFSRDHKGNVQAKANQHDLVNVSSQKLARAVFDIYLGDQVVCQKARTDGAQSFLKLIEPPAFVPPQSGLVCSESVCKVGRV